MKRKDKSKSIKEAQGRKSRQIRDLNKTKIQVLLAKQPLTFKQLEDEKIVSTPILSKHLKTLMREGRIQKAVKGNEIVYQVVSKEEAKNDVKSVFVFLLGYIFGMVSPKTKKSLKQVIEEAMKESSEPKELEEIKET